MKSKRFVFVGNRRFVLEQMIADNLSIEAIIIAAGTHLERDFAAGRVQCATEVFIVHNLTDVISVLERTKFDVLISNGCPYILPVQQLPEAIYVNIHPSCLPDLRGVDPVIGSIIYKRDSGATCHIMDSGIDTGPIISQVRIPYSGDLDAIILYQLSFIAEVQAYSLALARRFEMSSIQDCSGDLLYFSRRPEDRTITFQETNTVIAQKIKAFSNASQGCFFSSGGRNFKVYKSETMINSYLRSHALQFHEKTITLLCENGFIFHKDGEVIRFSCVCPVEDASLSVGDKLG